MIEITGKYGTAKVYVKDEEHLDEATRSQIYDIMNSKAVEGSQIRIMSDCHSGKGVCIGFTQKLPKENPRVVPSFVGCDIGCGVLVVKLDGKKVKELFGHEEGLKRLDKIVRERIPLGMKARTKLHKFSEKVHLENIRCPININKAKYNIGSAGSGNHYLELDVDSEGNYYLNVHSGSRHLGIEIESYYTKKAKEYHANCSKEKSDLIAKLKAEGREKDIQAELSKLKNPESVPSHLAYLEGDLLEDYLNDMKWAQEYAVWNREAMIDEILEAFKLRKAVLDKFCTIHNYIDIEDGIVRKGAISLEKDEKAIIPMNMADGCLIVKGKGNEDWNRSGPHGAGRLYSRSAAKEKLKMEDFKESMKGIYTTSVSASTIDESKMAYKPMQDIIDNIQDTCEIITRITPVWNVKAGEE